MADLLAPTFAEPTRRERRIAARKQQILTAATAVFSQKGYAGATTREIAETADISEGTLYNYFASKQDLLIGLAEAYADRVTSEMTAMTGETLEEVMAELLTARFQSGQERRMFLVFLSEARLNPDIDHSQIQDAFARIVRASEQRLETAVSAGRMRPINTRIVARAMSAMVMGFGALFELGGEVREGLTEDGEGNFSPDWLGQEVTDIFLNGLKPQAGAE